MKRTPTECIELAAVRLESIIKLAVVKPRFMIMTAQFITMFTDSELGLSSLSDQA